MQRLVLLLAHGKARRLVDVRDEIVSTTRKPIDAMHGVAQ